ncbi:MAG: glycosyltransferase family 4 protein [Candidatus Micrarchaeota archaeon]
MAETLKLLMLNPFFYPYQGGTEKHLLEVSKRLAERHDVTVLTSQLPDTKRLEKIYGVNVVRTPALILTKLPHPLPPPFPVMPQHGVDLWRLAKRADVVHAHNRFIYGLTEVALIRALDKTLCWTLHNARPMGIGPSTDLFGQAYDESVGRIVMRACDGVIGVSQATLDTTLPEDYDGVKSVVYNGVDEKMFTPGEASGNWRKRLGIPAGKKIVLCVCRLIEQKGLFFLLEAMREVDAALVLLGRGPLEKEIAAHAAAHGAANKFFPCTERISDSELVDLYRTAEVFVLPSLYEPFGMVIVEAMACGKPVIGTGVGGIPEIIREDTNGLIVPPRNPRALATAINAVLNNDAKARRFGLAGRKIVENEFTWMKTARGYEEFYKRVQLAEAECEAKRGEKREAKRGAKRGTERWAERGTGNGAKLGVGKAALFGRAWAKAFLSKGGVSVSSALKRRIKRRLSKLRKRVRKNLKRVKKLRKVKKAKNVKKSKTVKN